MKIRFSPIRSDANLTLVRAGDVLVVNGEAYDLSGIPEGATLPREAVAGDWLGDDITRQDGALQVTVILPHGPGAAPHSLFPSSIVMTEDGNVPLPGQGGSAQESMA